MVKNNVIVINGNNTRLLRRPEDDNVRLVINKFVNEIVVLTPAKITATINKSCEPKPVYFKLPENGVIKVQPETTAALLEHLLKKTFRLLDFVARLAIYQKDSGNLVTKFQNNNFKGVNTLIKNPS
jgi:hypothetical protein